MKGHQVRRTFLDFFISKGHTEVPSSSLVPHNDPTLLFSNAGMNQFKDCFLGAEKRAYSRATTSQKCLRISGKHNDFENVGVTARHHTFFEMLGNFSFGDYFKKEAIAYAWELATKVYKIDINRIWITIYEKDDEAFALWRDVANVSPDRIVRLGEADNFWAMGDTGPCGPCSEMHYYRGEDLSKQSAESLAKDGSLYLEFYNLVFMQFNRSADGTLHPLPKPAVDTGMGLERITSILNGVASNYDTDLLRDIISVTEGLSGFKYDGSSFTPRDLKTDLAYARDVAMRVIADHSRSAAFLVADGVNPSADGRGYILRRIIRRAIRHGRVLQFKEPFLKNTCAKVIEMFGSVYPELKENRDLILRIVDAEERKFHETLDAGLLLLHKEVEGIKRGALFSGKTAFLLHDTYGFPLDLTEDALKPFGIAVDHAEFNSQMSTQRERSREDRKSQGISYSAIKISGSKTKFLGYEATEAVSTVIDIINQDQELLVVTESTPFYAESGGQVGDTGQIIIKDIKLSVLDTQKLQDGFFVHRCKILEGVFADKLKSEKATLIVNIQRRIKIRTNHSATHLVHAALRNILGSHVKQAGSRVDANSLRFDYSHFEQVTPAQLKDIQLYVNQEIRNNYQIVTKEMKLEDAKKSGATALFGEKYGDIVRVVHIGDNSIELCGGTHANRSGDIGFMIVASESGIASGVRRIECFCADGAEREIIKERQERIEIASMLKSDLINLPEKVERVLLRTKELEREIDSIKGKLASAASADLASTIQSSPSGIKIIAQTVADLDAESLRTMVDSLRQKIGSGVVALGTVQGEKALLVIGVTQDLIPKLSAGHLVKGVAKIVGAKGGGRDDFAQAGGVDPARLNEALNTVVSLIG